MAHNHNQNHDHIYLLVRKPSHANGHGGNEGNALPTGRDEPVCESHPWKALKVENVKGEKPKPPTEDPES